MGAIHPPQPVLPLAALFSRHEAGLRWGRERLESQWGPVALASPAFDFTETDYYEPTMGPGIRKMFLVFERPMDPGELADRKLATNQWEEEYAALGLHAEPRPLNLDPGYLTAAKLVLASTKDHAHRIYLREGIFAEITLHWRDRRWQHHQWTFADYRREEYQRFFTEAREHLRAHEKGN